MYKLFTLEEANDLIPVVDETVGELQSSIADLVHLRGELQALDPLSLRARNLAQEIAFLLGQIQQAKAELDRLGVHLKDLEAGLVDFPSQLGAEVIYLTWEKGKDAITHYHRIGDESARPLPDPNAAQHLDGDRRTSS